MLPSFNKERIKTTFFVASLAKDFKQQLKQKTHFTRTTHQMILN